MIRIWKLSVILAAFLCSLPSMGGASDWIMVETRKVPKTCAHPLICIPQSNLVSRHLLNVSKQSRDRLYDYLKSAASISGIPNSAIEGLYPPNPQVLHKLEIAPKLLPLVDHPGVYFDSTKLDATEGSEHFSAELRKRLKALGVTLLTKEDWENTPGRPTLSLRYTARLESAGCIVPFSVSMTLKEDVVLVRDPNQKITATVWSYSRRQNLANTNYSPTNSLLEVLEKFESDWREAHNPKGAGSSG